jgi:hypothetical protein
MITTFGGAAAQPVLAINVANVGSRRLRICNRGKTAAENLTHRITEEIFIMVHFMQ